MGNKFSNLNYCNQTFQNQEELFTVVINFKDRPTQNLQLHYFGWRYCLDLLLVNINEDKELVKKKIVKNGYYNSEKLFACIHLPSEDALYACNIVYLTNSGICYNYEIIKQQRYNAIENIKTFILDVFPSYHEKICENIDMSLLKSNYLVYNFDNGDKLFINLTL